MKIKSLFVLVLFSGIITTAFAQQQSGELVAAGNQKLMIIPFNTYNYLSDADPELARANDRDPGTISTLFRYGLNYNLSARVISKGTYDILTDTTIDSQKDLWMIYSSIKYQFEKPIDIYAKDSAEDKSIKQPDLFGNGGEVAEEEEEKKKLFQKEEVVEETGDRRYLNAVITHPEIFANLQSKYGTDLFLFINQFELITNYNHCLDRSKNYFERKVVVHYSLYDATGRQLKGDAVYVTFSSGETNIDKIIADHFPIISDRLNESILASTNALPANK